VDRDPRRKIASILRRVLPLAFDKRRYDFMLLSVFSR
jgi:hypothetical protein